RGQREVQRALDSALFVEVGRSRLNNDHLKHNGICFTSLNASGHVAVASLPWQLTGARSSPRGQFANGRRIVRLPEYARTDHKQVGTGLSTWADCIRVYSAVDL